MSIQNYSELAREENKNEKIDIFSFEVEELYPVCDKDVIRDMEKRLHEIFEPYEHNYSEAER